MYMASGPNSVALGPRPWGGVTADRGSNQDKMPDLEEEEKMREPRDCMMTKIESETLTATDTAAGAPVLSTVPSVLS
jgi:hypothetical protein